jgi:transposase
MAVGKCDPREQVEWILTSDLPKSQGHPFYRKLSELLAKNGFDRFCEELCAPYYAEKMGRPSIPPGRYFRMLLVGYFEGIDSQRGIAWRCSDSLAVREFLQLKPGEASPDHSSLTVVRKRLPGEVFEKVFAWVLSITRENGLLKGDTVAVDSTTLEANAAMKSIVRKDTGEGWAEYVTGLAKAEGLENLTAEELRKFDRKRKGKKVSNEQWQSPTDPDSRITKMKSGDTHLAYKAEHAVDLESDVVLAAQIYHADKADSETLAGTVVAAQENLADAGSEQKIEEVAADKGYHSADLLAGCAEAGIRTYIVEPKPKGRRRWTDRPDGQREAVYANRRRCRRPKGRQLQRSRSEKVERSFAHVCETGGGRRSWIRGILEVTKRYLIQVAGHNLGILMRKLFGIGTPRSLQDSLGVLFSTVMTWQEPHCGPQGLFLRVRRVFRLDWLRHYSLPLVQLAA